MLVFLRIFSRHLHVSLTTAQRYAEFQSELVSVLSGDLDSELCHRSSFIERANSSDLTHFQYALPQDY
jgi:hypothetical protein